MLPSSLRSPLFATIAACLTFGSGCALDMESASDQGGSVVAIGGASTDDGVTAGSDASGAFTDLPGGSAGSGNQVVSDMPSSESVAAQFDCLAGDCLPVPGNFEGETQESPPEEQPVCLADPDCTDGYCGFDAGGGRACKAWALEGDSCEGYVLPQYHAKCDPGLMCAFVEATHDIPGSCRVPCSAEGPDTCVSGVCSETIDGDFACVPAAK